MSKEPNRNVYIGHRYVPKIMGEWDKTQKYEGLSIVLHEGASYTSKGYVPAGIDIKNEEFWSLTGNYNAQVENYRQEVYAFDDRITGNTDDITTHDTRIKNNTDDITAHDTRIKNNTDDLTTHDTRIKNNTDDITAHDTRIKDTQELLDSNISDLNSRGINIMNYENFKVATSDGFDFSPVFNKVMDIAPRGTKIIIPEGSFLLESGIDNLKDFQFEGQGWGSELLIKDYGIQMGRKDPRHDVFGSVKDIRFTGVNGTRGHVSDLYGTTFESLGFTSTTTPHAGTSDKKTKGVILAGVYTPIEVSGCFFYDLNQALLVGGQYGHLIQNNKIMWCNIGIETIGLAPTTVNINNNTVERCAIGIILKYPTTKITVHDNVVEANYGGCDILIFNQGEDISIKRNYFEASPQNIVLRADSSGDFSPHKLYIEDNFGVEIFARCELKHMYVKNNNLRKVQFETPVGSFIKNIVFEDNYEWSTAEPYNPENVTYNSEALKYYDEVEWKYSNNHIGDVTIDQPIYSGLIRSTKTFFAEAKTVEVGKGFTVEIPNVNVNALIEIRCLKYRNDLDWGSREIVYRAGIKRMIDKSVKSEISIASDELLSTLGGVEISPATTPNVSITGSNNGLQTIDMNFTNQSGGSTTQWLIEVVTLTNNTAIKVKK